MKRGRLGKKFPVRYMGSQRMKGGEMSLAGLQQPLRELCRRGGSREEATTLAVTEGGLKVEGEKEAETRPFSSVAVWTSVKAVFQRPNGSLEIGFVPLVNRRVRITDTRALFHQIHREDTSVFMKLKKDLREAGILVVVTMPVSTASGYECHGFICRSPEEATELAVTMHDVLLAKVECNNGGGTNGSGDAELTSLFTGTEGAVPQFPSELAERVVRSMRKRRGPTFQEIRTSDLDGRCHQGKDGEREDVRGTACRCHNEQLGDWVPRSGGILRKVALGRRGPGLEGTYPFWTCLHGQREAETMSRGLKELIQEFRVHEGLENVDDILNVIIRAEGMSFNNLRPIYKEFLLKLTLVLTKDELYKRTRSIMRRQTRYKRTYGTKRAMRFFGMDFQAFTMIASGIFRRAGSSKRMSNFKFANLIFFSEKRFIWSRLYQKLKGKSGKKLNKLVHRKDRRPATVGRRFCSFPWNAVSRSVSRPGPSPIAVCFPKHSFSTASQKSSWSCNYDTDSCVYSEKCYCLRHNEQGICKQHSVYTEEVSEKDHVPENILCLPTHEKGCGRVEERPCRHGMWDSRKFSGKLLDQHCPGHRMATGGQTTKVNLHYSETGCNSVLIQGKDHRFLGYWEEPLKSHPCHTTTYARSDHSCSCLIQFRTTMSSSNGHIGSSPFTHSRRMDVYHCFQICQSQ